MKELRFAPAAQLRAGFALSLSTLYGREVPLYRTLLDTALEVNHRALARHGASAERLGKIERVTAERHGAIRLGTPDELAQAAQIFAGFGMVPCGFYDLRDASPQAVPVVSTAFRPVAREELAANPFRVFTSLLVPEDRRFFDKDLERRIKEFLTRRTLFSPDLLTLAMRAEREGGLPVPEGLKYIEAATSAFAVSREPIDLRWYKELALISEVAADIAGVKSTHINHLTPRVLDIDDLYNSMTARGVKMIGAIQGPPVWSGPSLLLRQTSFRALNEPRVFRDEHGALRRGALRVRFGEAETRGIAITAAGRNLIDRLSREHESMKARDCTATLGSLWDARLPTTEDGLFDADLAFCTFHVQHPKSAWTPAQSSAINSCSLNRMLDESVLTREPIVYEDFLPRSAAGIFASNLTDAGTVNLHMEALKRDVSWLEAAIDRRVNDPERLYKQESDESLLQALGKLGSVTARCTPTELSSGRNPIAPESGLGTSYGSS